MIIDERVEEIKGKRVKITVYAPQGSFKTPHKAKKKNTKRRTRSGKVEDIVNPFEFCNWNNTALYCM